jgi:hypothetical protein
MLRLVSHIEDRGDKDNIKMDVTEMWEMKVTSSSATKELRCDGLGT